LVGGLAAVIALPMLIALNERAGSKDELILEGLSKAYGVTEHYAEAAATLEKLLTVVSQHDPKRLLFTRTLGFSYYQLKRYSDEAAIFQDALTLAQDPSVRLELMYDLACAEARQRHQAKALDWLRQAVAAGYADSDHMAKDDDLSSLHGDAEFERLV